MAFVDLLYSLGAVRVDLVGDDDESKPPDTAVIVLPSDPPARRALFALVEREARHEGFDAERDLGQAEVILWWN